MGLLLIVRNWKSPHKPQHEDWIKLKKETVSFESLIANINNIQGLTGQISNFCSLSSVFIVGKKIQNNKNFTNKKKGGLFK